MTKLIVVLALCAVANAYSAEPQSFGVNIGRPVNLEKAADGPNVDITINSADTWNVTFTTVDYERMQVAIVGGNGGSYAPTVRQQKAITGDATLVFHRGAFSVYFTGSSMNRATLTVVKE